MRITDKIYFTVECFPNTVVKKSHDFQFIRVDHEFHYVAYCDDFGPMNLGTVFRFCQDMDKKLEVGPVVIQTSPRPEDVTNSLFLTGSYLIMNLDYDLSAVSDSLLTMLHATIPFRDVSGSEQNFELLIEDCWGGLFRAKSLGWVDFRPGGFDLEDYDHFDHPLQADMHEVVPGKFVAMKGPKDLTGCMNWEDVLNHDGSFSHRVFSPTHYAEKLEQFDVRAVVRLNTPAYDAAGFERAGMPVMDLPFDDCATPPMDVVAKFLLLSEKLPGALAVHCHAGLGRTGTLIALYMMKHHGFTAREAMGWLRIVRPGSVIGPQQAFLCAQEGRMRRQGELLRQPGGVRLALEPLEEGATAEAVAGLIRDVHSLVDDRARALSCRSASAVAAAVEAAREELAARVAAACDQRSGRRSSPMGVGELCVSPGAPAQGVKHKLF